MNQTTEIMRSRIMADPFEPSAFARLRRANLVSAEGVAYGQAVATLASSLAAFLFDDFCDCRDSHDDILSFKEALLNAQASGLSKRKIFIDICLLYDYICKPHPEVMWWMAGNDSVVAAFVDAYLAKFAMCCTELEQEVPRDET